MQGGRVAIFSDFFQNSVNGMHGRDWPFPKKKKFAKTATLPPCSCPWQFSNSPGVQILRESRGNWKITGPSLPETIDQPDAKPMAPSLCRNYIGVEFVRSVGCNWSFYPGGGGPYFYQILQYICPRIPGQFSISRLTARTKRVAAKSIAAIPAESILFIGVAVITADTGYELYAACETVRDLDQLYSDLGVADETQDDVMHSVCVPELPVLWAP
jgi:hypothetical protein